MRDTEAIRSDASKATSFHQLLNLQLEVMLDSRDLAQEEARKSDERWAGVTGAIDYIKDLYRVESEPAKTAPHYSSELRAPVTSHLIEPGAEGKGAGHVSGDSQ